MSPLKNVEIGDFKNSMDVLERAYHLSIAKNSIDKLHACDLVICPDELDTYHTFSIRHLDDIFDLGYRKSIIALKAYENRIH